MGYERYPRNNNPQGGNYGRRDPQDDGRDSGSGRDASYSSARDYAAGRNDRDDDDRGDYGRREYGHQRYDQHEQSGGGDYGQQNRGYDDRGGYRGQSQGSYGQGSYGQGSSGQGDYRQRGSDSGYYQGSYASEQRAGGQDRDRQRDQGRGQGYGRQPQGDGYDDRGFLARAGDEVRSWFGDEDAERRREADLRYNEGAGRERDDHYHSWRSSQIASLDRDYDEYRRENRTKFDSEFGSWRSERQGQRDYLAKVDEHMEVVGSDGGHVGTVDKVRGDDVILTKNDADAGGRHHSFPSRWIKSVDDKVTVSRTADEAKKHWRDAERSQATFGEDKPDKAQAPGTSREGLDRSFSGG